MRRRDLVEVLTGAEGTRFTPEGPIFTVGSSTDPFRPLSESPRADIGCPEQASTPHSRGSHPQRDTALVRRIVEGVVRDHDERSLTGMVAPVGDVDTLVGELVARVSGFGPLQPYLDDPAVEEVWINDPS